MAPKIGGVPAAKSSLKKSTTKKGPTTFTQNEQPAKQSVPSHTSPNPNPFIFKGHPQPPVDERLHVARNFLADEDPDRCLEFDKKISEIEELIAHIETDSVHCDPNLFRDVKVKIKVHRDWEARRKTSPYDTGCCEAPLIAPFSTRLINAETAATLRQEREAQGLAVQMRSDHAPFSINDEDHHGAFLARMREDATTDPDEVDQESNLLWRESRAYLWATRDPALIPHWMHPRNGIPTKGVNATIGNQPRVPSSPTESQLPSPRGWIPTYVAATEHEINRLVAIQGPNQDEFNRMVELLRPYEPQKLQRLREQRGFYTNAAAMGSLSPEQEAFRDRIRQNFYNEEGAWLDSILENGIQFIIRTSSDPQIVQPGFINIGDGVMTPDHITTLGDAQALLDKLLQSGRQALTQEEADSLDSLLQYSLPANILNIQKEISGILLKQGVNHESELDQNGLERFVDRRQKELELQNNWEKELRQSGGAKFRYLRPAEMKSSECNILYLPWDVTAIPRVQLQDRPDLALPANVQQLQDEVNEVLAQGINFEDINNVPMEFREKLEQLVYQDLRDLLTPYFALEEKRASNGQQLSPAEQAQYTAVAGVVPTLWEVWWLGLGKQITIKMPLRGQLNKTPGVMYCRNPTQKPVDEDLETYFTRKASEINDIIRQYHSAEANGISGDDEKKLVDKLAHLCKDLQYPALKKLDEQYNASVDQQTNDQDIFHEIWSNAFIAWLESKREHTIRIKTFNGLIDPDDDPSVVYYRGPILAPEKFLGLSEDVKSTITTRQNLNQPALSADLRPQLPPLLRRLMDVNERLPTATSQAVLDWHLQAFMTVPTSSSTYSTKLTTGVVPSASPPSSLDSSEIGAVTGNEEDTQIPGKVSSSTATKFEQLKTDLSPFLPDIRAIEREINRLLALFRQYSVLLSQGDFDVLELGSDQLGLHSRLTELLRQFWPDNVFERYQRAERFHKLGAYANQMSAREYEDTIEAYSMDFLKAYGIWLTELISTGVHIQISATEVYTTNSTILVFQPGMSLKPFPDGQLFFCVHAPEMINSKINEQTSELVCKVSYDNSQSIANDLELVRFLDQRQNDINCLLIQRDSQGLSWDQSELLLHYLRPFMPPDLAELDSILTTLDEEAREKMLDGPEQGDWYQFWDSWNRMYQSWLEGFPSGIVLDKEVQFGDQPRLLRLRVSNPESMQKHQRRTNLPVHLQDREDDINRLPQNETSMSREDRAKLDQVLAPLFRPILKRFRGMALDHVRGICKRDGTQLEDAVLMEALVSFAQSILKRIVASSTAARRIRFQEPVPGSYGVIVVDHSGRSIFPTSEDDQIKLAEQMLEQLCATELEASKREFHDAAQSIRTGQSLSQAATNFLQNNIPSIVIEDISKLKNRVMEILDSLEKEDMDEDKGEKDLAQAITRLFWKQLIMMHPEQERNILQLLGNPRLPSRTPALVARRLPGSLPLEPSPVRVTPSQDELKEVEIEINNLLRAERANTINKEQQGKLDYLLRGLLPQRLRFLKNRVDSLEAQYLARDGLEIFDSLQFADMQEVLERMFQEWKQKITGLGIVLDKWLSTPEAIAEVCSRAYQWGIVKFGPGSGYISDKLEDGDVKQCQEIYATFRRFVEGRCQDRAGVDYQILLRSAPTQINNQIKQIQGLLLKGNEATDKDTRHQYALMLQTLSVQLMKLYMRWLTSQSPMGRQTLGSRLRGMYDSSTNFAPKAERRGIQRAAIELALNLLATNQEQHRPKDRFRMVELPLQLQLPEREVPLCLPLKPEDRPLEQDPFEYTKKLLAFRRWKDYDYDIARVRSSTDRNGEIPPPANYNGPTSIASVDNVHDAARTQVTALASIQKGLIQAQNMAPRPLLQQLLLLTDAGLNYTKQRGHELYDDELLTSDGVDLLNEIAGLSWDEEREEYGEDLSEVDNTHDDRGRLQEFELDVAEITGQLPLWTPALDPDAMDEDGFGLFQQPPYDDQIPSEQYMDITQVRQIIGDNRLAKSNSTAGTSPPWNSVDVERYLRAMASAHRIHLDEYEDGNIYVSRIPLSGHPENKYVISRDEAATSAGVFRDNDDKLQVHYDSFGRVGPPILQPNKYHYLQRLAFRLGRDLRKNADVLANAEKPLAERVQEQEASRVLAETEMENILPADRSGGPSITNSVDPLPVNITLQRMAQDLFKVAPDLAQDAGFTITSPNEITEEQAAVLLQMQVLEEVSNNWEYKFTENEHVWDFAATRRQKTTRKINGRSIQGRPRLAQFFHMRRFPPCCQSEATKEIIKQSGPKIQERPEAEAVPEQNVDDDDDDPPKKKVRHIKGREPYFSLGESAFERAFLSWRMEQELKDVPEFQPAKKRRSWWSFGKGNAGDDDQDLPRDRYPLPKIPDKWHPENISIAEKRAQVLQLAKQDGGFPNPEILEYYHTPDEIKQIKLQRQWDEFAMKRKIADAAVETLTGKQFDSLSRQELNQAYTALGINALNGLFIDDAKNTPAATKQARRQRQNAPTANMALRTQRDQGLYTGPVTTSGAL